MSEEGQLDGVGRISNTVFDAFSLRIEYRVTIGQERVSHLLELALRRAAWFNRVESFFVRRTPVNLVSRALSLDFVFRPGQQAFQSGGARHDFLT